MATTLKILILEDNPDDAEIILRLLKKEKIRAEFFVTMTREGLEDALEQFKPDLILSDNSMPQFNATEALDIINERAIHIPFILVTGNVSEEFAVNIVKQGADDYILKDRLARLPAAINAALGIRKAEKEKKEAEKKIMQSEANLRAIFENATEGFLLLDRNGIIKTFNSKAAEYSFLSGNTTLQTGQTIFNFIEEKRRPEFQKIISTVLDGNSVHYERQYEFEDRETIWVEFSKTPVKADSKVVGICISSRDITEKKIAEQQIAFDSNNLKALINNTGDLMWSVDQDLRLITFNDAFSKVIEVLIGAAPAKGDYVLSDKFTQNQLARYRTFYQRALSGETFNIVDHFDQPYEYWSETSFYPIRKGDEVIGTACFSRNITQRKKDEEKIHKSEEQYRDLIENISDIICTHDLDGRLLSANKAAEELMGHKFNPEENLNIKDILAPGKKHMFDEYITQLKTEGHAQGLMEVQTFKGNMHICEYNNSLKTTDGESIVRGYVRDITETKKAVDKIRFDAELLNTVGQSVIATDSNGVVIYWNNAAEKIYGWSSAETMGKCIINLIPAQQSIEMAEEIMKELMRGNSWTGEFLVNRKDGTVFPAHVTNSPIFDNQGKIIGIIGVSMDISERKKSTEKLRESNERYEFVNKATQDTIWEWDYATREGKWGEGIINIFGYKEDKIKYNESWLDEYVHPYDKEEVTRRIQTSIESGIEIWQDEFRFRCADGSYKNVFDRGFILFDEEGNPYRMYGAMSDITEQKQLERELAEYLVRQQKIITETTIQAQEVERNQLGRELHDNINQILATVKMYLGLIVSGKDNSKELVEKSYEYVNHAMEEIRQLSHSLVAPSLGDIGLEESLEEMVENSNLFSKMKIHLSVNKNYKKEGTNKNKELMIYRIVQEQLHNITKYAKAEEVLITLKSEGKNLFLSVADNGVGFDTTQKNKGIGLKNMCNRVEFYAGQMHIISSPGKGCKLQVQIPY